MDFMKDLVIRFLKIPPEPPQPFGDEDSVLVFRASPKYFKYKLLQWAISTIIGIIVFMVFCGGGAIAFAFGGALGEWSMPVGILTIIILLGFVLFQTLFSYVNLRLDYEMRWYKVTDRSIRIREGVIFVRDMIMTNKNIQNISVTQGPLERYFGISNLKVQTAGGGGSVAAEGNQNGKGFFNMHEGYFRGVENAEEIRKILRERLKNVRDSGLGDHDDPLEEQGHSSQPTGQISQETTLAAQELLAEASAYRQTLQRYLSN